MDWEYVEMVFGRDVEFTRASRDEVFDALSRLERELGLSWIKATKASLATTSALGRMVEFAKCLKTADAVIDGNLLKLKLCTDYLSDECQGAIAEALTAERLLASGATVQYEPQLPSTTKRPDFLANWGTQQVAFEVVFPTLSFQDLSENRQLAAMLSECTVLLASGTLNIYLTEISPTADTVNAIISAVRLLSDDTTHTHELHLADRAFLTYDPVLHERIALPREDLLGENDDYAFPVTDPAYYEVKSKLKILTPMYSEIAIRGGFQGNRSLRAKLIVRIHRPVLDSRAWGKAEQKHQQLPPGSAGVVVIDMSRTSMSLRPEQWAKQIRDSFGPNLCPRISAVWLRSGQPEAGAEWREWLIINPYAATKLPTNIAKQLIPGLAPLDLD